MLALLVLFALLQTPRGGSVPSSPVSSSAVAAVDASTVIACECPGSVDDGGQQLRTVYEIVKSCLFTIFACVWQSAHPNINGPRDSGWVCFKRKVVTMFYALIAPEMVLAWALRQRAAAQEIAERYNNKFANREERETTIWQKILGWFQPLPKYMTTRGDGQPWTITHGFFIQMGGFILYDNGLPKEVLNYESLNNLLSKKAIDAPTVTERDLQDRSKGDNISKAIVVLQTTWFAFQCVARAGQHLPVSELEVLTLAFAVLNVVIYAVWWNKPQDVDMAICVPLKKADNGLDFRTLLARFDTDPIGFSDAYSLLVASHESELNPQHDETVGHKHSWLQRMLRKARERHNSPYFFLVSISSLIVGYVLHPLYKMGKAVKFELQKQLRVPMFYTAHTADSLSIGQATCAFGMIFGAIHLLAWASKFPSLLDLVLWRVAAIIITVEPLLLLVAAILESNMVGEILGFLFIFLVPLYVASRGILITIAIRAIHHPPHDVLDISWTTYIPHF